MIFEQKKKQFILPPAFHLEVGEFLPKIVKKGIKTILKLFLILILLFATVIVAMQISTIQLIDKMRNAMLSPVFYVSEEAYNLYVDEFPKKYKNPNVTYVIYKEGDNIDLFYKRYSPRQSLPIGVEFEDCIFEFKVKYTFAWHNFERGYLWVKYNCQTILPDGTITNGGYGVIAKITIEKQNGNWAATEIYERP